MFIYHCISHQLENLCLTIDTKYIFIFTETIINLLSAFQVKAMTILGICDVKGRYKPDLKEILLCSMFSWQEIITLTPITQRCHVLIPGNCECLTWRKRNFTNVTKVKILRWEGVPGLSQAKLHRSFKDKGINITQNSTDIFILAE